MMHSLPEDYRALVFGASGAMGQAFVQTLQSDPRCAKVCGVSRQSSPGFDLLVESSIATCAQALAAQASEQWTLSPTIGRPQTAQSQALQQMFLYCCCWLSDRALKLKCLSFSLRAVLHASNSALPILQHRSLLEISMNSVANSMGEGVAFFLKM